MTIVKTSSPWFKRFVWLLCEGWISRKTREDAKNGGDLGRGMEMERSDGFE